MFKSTLRILVESALMIRIDQVKSYEFEDMHDTLAKIMPAVIFMPTSSDKLESALIKF